MLLSVYVSVCPPQGYVPLIWIDAFVCVYTVHVLVTAGLLIVAEYLTIVMVRHKPKVEEITIYQYVWMCKLLQ